MTSHSRTAALALAALLLVFAIDLPVGGHLPRNRTRIRNCRPTMPRTKKMRSRPSRRTPADDDVGDEADEEDDSADDTADDASR